MQGFKEINAFLNSYVNELYKIKNFQVEKYIETMDEIYDIGLKSFQEGCHYFQNIESVALPKKKISMEESIFLLISYLKTIDSSFLNRFDKAYNDGIIHFTTLEELKQETYDETNFFRFKNLTGVINSKPFIHIVLEESIADTFTLLHEFSHYKNGLCGEETSISYSLFTEGYAHMFETDFYHFLLGTKWEEEAFIYYQGLLLSLLNRTANYIREYGVFSTFLRYRRISNQTIYRFCKDSNHTKENMQLYFDTIKNIIVKIEDPGSYFFEDIPYVVGLPFSKEVRKQFLRDKDVFLEEYENLKEQDKEYYYKKYVKTSSLEHLYQILPK